MLCIGCESGVSCFYGNPHDGALEEGLDTRDVIVDYFQIERRDRLGTDGISDGVLVRDFEMAGSNHVRMFMRLVDFGITGVMWLLSGRSLSVVWYIPRGGIGASGEPICGVD